ncbi:MAG TPA: anti-sigma factor antagonist [Planctomycetota bacterium]|nr:anti-sigma factor antagonist [Planctomycetota bacterium]
MASIEFRVKVVKSPDGTTATLAEVDGSIDASTIQQFQQVMDKLVERGVKNLILDCTNVKYINSTGLGTLLKYSDTFESIGGHIAFCRVPSKVMLVMEMLGFNALFNIVTDEATALRSFAGKLAPPPSVSVKTSPAPAPSAYPQSAPAAPAFVAAPAAPAPAPAPAAAAAVTFPIQTACARCRVTLDVPAPGKFKCPRCTAVLAVEPTGRVRFFASKKSKPIAVSIPCNSVVADGVASLAAKCAESLGFNGKASEVETAVSVACKNVIERAYDNDANSTFHLLIVPNGSSLTIKISDYGKPFDFGPGGSIQADGRFSDVVNAMDTVEHRPNPKGGNLLTLIKVLQ